MKESAQYRYYVFVSLGVHAASILIFFGVSWRSYQGASFTIFSRNVAQVQAAYFWSPPVLERQVVSSEPVVGGMQSVSMTKHVRGQSQQKKVAAKKKPQQPQHKAQLQKSQKRVVRSTQKQSSSTGKKVSQTHVAHGIAFGDVSPHYVAHQRELQKKIFDLWRPPLGIDAAKQCVLRVHASRNGDCTCELIEKSGVLIYDLSVLQAARQLTLSERFAGMSFSITFKQ